MKKTIFERLHDVRLAYGQQVAELEASYAAKLKACEARIKEAKAHDYEADFTVRYGEALTAMEGLLGRIQEIEKTARGLSFTTKAYLPSASPIPIPHGGVEEVFGRIISDMGALSDVLSRDHSMDEYASLLQRFCDLLATMRLIEAESSRLLKESGLPAAERLSRLTPLEREYARLTEEKKTALAVENLPCGVEFFAVRDEIRATAARVAEDMLGSGKFRFDPEFRFLIGFYKEKIPADDAAFAKSVMGLTEQELSGAPVYFTPETGKKNIIINANKRDFGSPRYKALIHNLYLSVAGRLPPNCLEYGYISCGITSRADFKALRNTIATTLGRRKEGSSEGNYVYGEGAEDQNKVPEMLRKLSDDAVNECSMIGTRSSIYEFNRLADYDRRPLRLIFVDSYPAGFDGREESGPMLEQLLGNEYTRKSGFLFIVGQNTEATPANNYAEPAPVLQGGEDSLVLDIRDPDHVRIDGREITLNVTVKGYSEPAQWQQLNDYYVRRKTFLLGDLFDETESSPASSPFENGGLLEVPLGYRGAEIYKWTFSIKEACHIFVVGGSGSGKTSFIHTFILSTAFKYSPKDVQFYLADWKGSEFSFYKTAPMRGGKAIPHVHYLQDKNSFGDYITFVRMVLRIAEDRNRLFKREGCQDLLSYNRLMDRRGQERLPFLFVIIDEYQTMLSSEQGSTRTRDAWLDRVRALLNVARSAGIALVLCAQNEESDIDLKNVQHRVVMGVAEKAEDLIRRTLYDNDRSEQTNSRVTADANYLSVKQDGRAIIGRSSNRDPVNVRAAYSGNHEERLPLTARIADRHGVTMPLILGGNEEPYNIDLPTDPPYLHMNDPVPNAEAEYGFDDFATGLYDETAFPLYIGVSTTDAYPTALPFTTDAKKEGYAFYTEDEFRMVRMVNSLMLSFLFKTASLGIRYEDPRILYIGSTESFQRDAGFFKDPRLAKHLKFCNVREFGAIEQIASLAKLMEQRTDMDAPGGRFSPYLVILRELDWLKDPTLSGRIEKWRNSAHEEAGEPAYDETELRQVMDEIRVQYEAFGFPTDEASLRSAALDYLRQQNRAPARKAPPEIPDANFIRTSVANLFARGNGTAIHLVVASRSGKELSEFRKSILREYTGPFERIVYGSYAEMVAGPDGQPQETGQRELATICYVQPGEMKTRIYSYNREKNPGWWKQLFAALGEKE